MSQASKTISIYQVNYSYGILPTSESWIIEGTDHLLEEVAHEARRLLINERVFIKIRYLGEKRD